MGKSRVTKKDIDRWTLTAIETDKKAHLEYLTNGILTDGFLSHLIAQHRKLYHNENLLTIYIPMSKRITCEEVPEELKNDVIVERLGLLNDTFSPTCPKKIYETKMSEMGLKPTPYYKKKRFIFIVVDNEDNAILGLV